LLLVFLVEVADAQATDPLLALLVFDRRLDQANRGVYPGRVNLGSSIGAT
jgi:hypothetical protein